MSRRAAFLLPDMGGGGAERLTLDLMAGFLTRGAEVDLVLQAEAGEFLPLVPKGVRIVDLATPRLRNVAGPLRRYYRAERPDAVLAAMWPLTSIAVLAAAGLNKRPRVIVSEHCPLLAQYAASGATRAALRSTVPLTYRFADGVVAISDGLAGEVARLAGLPRQRVEVIGNPIPPPLRSGRLAGWGGHPGKRILSVGSLKAVKNFPLLLRAFARLARDREAVLAIIGEGGERSALEALARALGIADRVLLPGFTATPGDWYASADLFALTSDYEGLGNVLIEAMHCGLPVVATDCPYGPREVLEGERWGQLVPVGDEVALTAAMAGALDAPCDAAAQHARAAEFSVERAVAAYWRLMFGR